jgi:hypothetical protein
MKTAKSESEFDKIIQTCPYRRYPCVKDDCTHFERYSGKYENLKIKEEWNAASCHAGQHIQLWSELKTTNKPSEPTTLKEWLLMIGSIIMFILLLYFMTIMRH